MNNLRRILAIVLVFVVLSGMISPVSAADTAGGNLSALIAQLPTISDPMGTAYYFYNQLSDAEKAIYWELQEATWDSPDIVLTGISGYSADELQIMCQNALTVIIADDPAFHMFWERYAKGELEGNQFRYRLIKNPAASEYRIAKAKARIDDIVATVGMEGDLYSRVRDLLDLMCREMDYNWDSCMVDGYTAEEANFDDCALGCLLYDTAVCAGFSDTVKILCDALLIPCITVGNAGHAWNFVRMEDGCWYSVDTSADISADQQLLGETSHEYVYNGNYHIGDHFYHGNSHDLIFPTLARESYIYCGIYEASYHNVQNSFAEPAATYRYRINGDGKTCTITAYEGAQAGDLVIPSSVDGYTVTAIGNAAFYGLSGFSGDLIIADTVEIIESRAFYHCSGFESMHLSNALIHVDDLAFIGCKNLTGTLQLPNKIEFIGKCAFWDCSNLSGNITLPESLVSLGDSAFGRCYGLNGSFYLPDGLEYNSTMLSQTGITEIQVSSSNHRYTTRDGVLYSKNMTTLVSCPPAKAGTVTIPEGVTEIAKAAFYWCEFINGELVLPKGLQSIGAWAFLEAGFTGDLIIPDSVVSIGHSAFAGANFDGYLKISTNITKIEHDTFAGCAFVGDLIIPDSVIEIEYNAFFGCQQWTGELQLSDNIEYIGTWAIGATFTNALDLSGSHVTLAENALMGCWFSYFDCNCDSGYTVNQTWNGEYTFTCNHCYGSYQSASPKKGHTYTNDQDTICDDCGWVRHVDAEYPPNPPVVHMFRMYDPNSGEHFYTGSEVEKSDLLVAGWNYEGIGFSFPVVGAPVYRLYDPVYGEHLYTMDIDEVNYLIGEGWNNEGIAFNTAPETEVPQYRLHNPNEKRGAYHFTSSAEERDNLLAVGWEYQGIGWYSCWK